jgi:hypothetical protein
MIEAIEACSQSFPVEHDSRCGYWHMHLPVDQAFIDSKKTPPWVRRRCIQSLVDATERLRSLAPKSEGPVRVVACVSLPDLWDSQIIVFFGHEYFSTFFDRDSQYQRWKPLRESRSISREWNLEVPDGFQAKGFHEGIRDDGFHREGEVWFIGELD